MDHWRRWCRESGRVPVIAPTPEPDRILRHLAEAFLREADAIQAAEEWLARRAGRETAALRLPARTEYELRLLCDSASLGDAGPDRLCRRLLMARAGGEPLTAETVAGWFADIDGPLERLAAVLSAWEAMAPSGGPALLLVPEADTGSIHAAAQCVSLLVSHAPQAVVGIALPRAAFDEYLATTPESFAKAVLRESVAPVAGLDADAIRRLVEARLGRIPDALRPAIERLAGRGATPDLAARFAEAAAESWSPERSTEPSSSRSPDQARSSHSPADSTSPADPASAVPVTGASSPAVNPKAADDGSHSDLARSAAEAYLHEVLESTPDLSGMFELNAKPGFRFGKKPAEIDLACRRLRIAIEIDGYYHFGDPAAYRRDRRKDWALQRHGFLVLRFLADDVASEIETICETIRAAVRWRNGSQ